MRSCLSSPREMLERGRHIHRQSGITVGRGRLAVWLDCSSRSVNYGASWCSRGVFPHLPALQISGELANVVIVFAGDGFLYSPQLLDNFVRQLLYLPLIQLECKFPDSRTLAVHRLHAHEAWFRRWQGGGSSKSTNNLRHARLTRRCVWRRSERLQVALACV